MVNFYLHGSRIFRPFYPSLLWQIKQPEKVVYLTFDDGPEPEVTSFVLKTLEQYGFEATFFCIGENVVSHPETYNQVLQKGHRVANHTFTHPNGFEMTVDDYVDNVGKAAERIDSNLFRPPYGRIKRSQIKRLKNKYKIVMWSIISGDFDDRLDVKNALKRMKQLTAPGSIVVFHDSLKALDNLTFLLPKYCEFLVEQGYTSCKL